MRIGLLASVGETIGAFFPEIVSSWRDSGHEVFTAAGTPDVGVQTVIKGISRTPREARPRSAFAGLREWALDNSLEVVVTNTAVASALARTSGLRVPVVYFCHGFHWNKATLGSSLWRAAETLLLHRTAGVIVLNSDDQEWVTKKWRHPPILRLAMGVGLNPETYARQPIPPEPNLTLCWIGEFSARKDPLAAITCFEHILSDLPNARLQMAGDGELLAASRALAEERRLGGRVEFLGRVPAQAVIAGAHALIHTATWEGLPRVLLEASAVGRQSFAFDVKGCRDAPGVLLMEAGDSFAMARSVVAWDSAGRPVPSLPSPEALSNRLAARYIAEFIDGAVIG